MRLLEVNNASLLGASHQEAVNALRCAGNTIRLVVCKGNLFLECLSFFFATPFVPLLSFFLTAVRF